MTSILNLRVEIYRKETDRSGTIHRTHQQNLTLSEGDEIRFSIMNVEEKPDQSLQGKVKK